ncbi:GFA family protein [Sphingomonas oryzagri]
MSEIQLPITGGCLCGAIRYKISKPPLGSRTCWCRLCQYLASGSATVNLIVAADAVTITGPLKTFDRVADSGNHMTRGFCLECGTHVTSASAETGHLRVIRTGTLDDPNLMGPQATIWADMAPHWAPLNPDLPKHAKQPPPVA